MTHNRQRFQNGSLTRERRRSGNTVWVFRWREMDADGKKVHRKIILGTTRELPSKSAAEQAASAHRTDINALTLQTKMSVGQVAEHYRLVELRGNQSGNKSARTIATYEGYIQNFIVPKWGQTHLTDVKAVMVERWLNGLPGAPATKSKIRAVFSILFRHAMRYEWAQANPISLVRQSAKRQMEPVILEVDEVRLLLNELEQQDEPFRTLVFTAVVTGLRRGELFGLKWQDIDTSRSRVFVVRSLVNGIEGKPKTATSCKPIPLTRELAEVLAAWREKSPFKADDDWVFASPQSSGKMPYWPDSALYKRIRPAAVNAGITKPIGWHSFRRTTASLLLSSGVSIRTAQELMRHASPEMTLGVYAQALSPDRLSAQSGIAALITGRTAVAIGPVQQ